MTEAAALRRIVRVQDLADDAAVIADYEAAHRPGATPAEVIDVQRRNGIHELEIYRHANRLVMIMTVTDDFDPAEIDRQSATVPALVEWQRRMGTLQRRPAGSDIDWPEALPVFRQTDHY